MIHSYILDYSKVLISFSFVCA